MSEQAAAASMADQAARDLAAMAAQLTTAVSAFRLE
jgi:hypothetical protein